jgi:hypothetical protein
VSEATHAAAAPAHLWPTLPPGTPVVVLGAVPAACFLQLPGTAAESGGVVAILSAEASLLPFGVRTAIPAATSPWRRLRPGAEGVIGGRGIRLPGVQLSIGRWWRPATVARTRGRRAVAERDLRRGTAVLDAALCAHPQAPALPAYGEAAGCDPGSLVGRGPGLTPYGDDVLAGRLLGVVAWGGEPDRTALAGAVLAAARGRTTAVSLACLGEAAQGRCVPEAARLVDAMSGPAPMTVAGASAALLRVGHTSGHGLAVGLRDGATAALAARAACA